MRIVEKRLWAFILAAAILLSLTGCASEPASAQQTVPVISETQSAVSEAETTEAPATEETEAPVLEGSLFLKVSSITFSLVGECEDIYLGVIPRELVTWESENPDIISVEDGVLTAVSVGTTVIHASYEDRQVSCMAGCLAQTQEELEALDSKILSAPKRMIPEVDLEEPCTYFDNAAIVGDSITYGLMQYESGSNALGDILFLARGGVSIIGFVKGVKNLIFRGSEMELEDIIAQADVERVYILMGSNDVMAKYPMDYMMENWRTMLDRIAEKNPDTELVVISSIPMYEKSPHLEKPDSYNPMTVEYNDNLRMMVKEYGFKFLDLHSYYEDHWGRLPFTYKIEVDNTHLNKTGCENWMKIMRYYARYESEGGILE